MQITAEQIARWLEQSPGVIPELAARRVHFYAQWTSETSPACPEGLELLWQLAAQSPSLYAIAEKNGFLDPTFPPLRKNAAWQAFAFHYKRCPNCPTCNEV